MTNKNDNRRPARKPRPPKQVSKVGIPQIGDRPERVRLLPGEKRA